LSGAVVAIAEVIQWPIAFAALWLYWATLTAAEAMVPRWPRTVLALLDVGEWCSRTARVYYRRPSRASGHDRGRTGVSLRFRRRFRVAPGITLNLSKSGLSTSIGVRGAHVTFGRRGRRATIGLPGSGLSWSEYQPYRHHLVEPHPGATLFWIVILVIVFAWLLSGH
jgi:uncharacterized protein DUF4236